MGLGAPKKRNKLSHDPNNTAWSKSTTNYGHRILSSQGWSPGDYLGAENASHGEHYTAANASHIRVLLREDNLGIGAQVGGKGNAETFGLSTLSSIFGRLNGKTEFEVQKQQSGLRDAELRTYQVQKYGFMNFVSGGLLVGDKIEAVPDKRLAAKTVDAKAPSTDKEAKAGKKRKAESDGEEAVSEKRMRKKGQKSELKAKHEVPTSAEDNVEPKKSKKRRKEEAVATTAASATPHTAEETNSTIQEEKEKSLRHAKKERRRAERAERRSEEVVATDEKARLKQEKRAHKEERRRRKEEKRRLAAEKTESAVSQSVAPEKLVVKPEEPLSSGVSTPTQDNLAFGGSRHALRQRYIQQKRMASMDPKALNEILMIKAQA